MHLNLRRSVDTAWVLPQWKATFGYFDTNTQSYAIKAQWQTALGAIGISGQIIGLAINGYLTGYIGYRRTMLIFLVLLTGFLFIPFFAKDIKILMAGQFLQGIPCMYDLRTCERISN